VQAQTLETKYFNRDIFRKITSEILKYAAVLIDDDALALSL
jgi:hypothetical protein